MAAKVSIGLRGGRVIKYSEVRLVTSKDEMGKFTKLHYTVVFHREPSYSNPLKNESSTGDKVAFPLQTFAYGYNYIFLTSLCTYVLLQY